MTNPMNKKLAEVLSKMDDKVLQAKLNAMADMLKNSSPDDIAKKLGKVDKNELLDKLNDFDDARLKDLNINKEEFRQRLNSTDLASLQKMFGEHGDEIIRKIKDILK